MTLEDKTLPALCCAPHLLPVKLHLSPNMISLRILTSCEKIKEFSLFFSPFPHTLCAPSKMEASYPLLPFPPLKINRQIPKLWGTDWDQLQNSLLLFSRSSLTESHRQSPLCHAVCCCGVTKSCPVLCDPEGCSVPGFPVLYALLEGAAILGNIFSGSKD